MSVINEVLVLKSQGNDKFKNKNYQDACLLYGKAIELLTSIEKQLNNKLQIRQFPIDIKASLFSNLAISNYKLEEYEGSRRCCNAALVFCVKIYLPLVDLGIDDDITKDVSINTVKLVIIL